MPLEFIGSSKPTIGVEIELQILDPESLDLTPKAELLLEKCQSIGIERVKTEIHQSMLEVDSEISDDVKQCREFLSSRIQQLNLTANELGLQLAVLGTHPFQRWSDRLISTHDRYQNVHQKYQWLARRVNVYGLHVHIGVESGEQALTISNALVRYLPHLLTLSANSPFWQGIDTGMQSSRINIMESFPLAGIPHQFNHWGEFEHYCETLLRAGAIRSIKDLYWFIRPNLQFGTIEFRICDALSNLNETMGLVALIQSLVVFVGKNIETNPDEWKWSKEQQWIAPENQWIAARDGLEGIITTDSGGQRQKISESILQLVELLSPTAISLNCIDELQYIKHIITNGNGAQRQRNIFKETQSLRDVVNASIKEFELNTAMIST
jgi:glutamate---cysteine ligase / carboxylate-amine ligase